MSRRWIQFATFAAYLPSAALPVIADRADAPGGPLDPSVLVVPFCLAFAAGVPGLGPAGGPHAGRRVIALALGLIAVTGAAGRVRARRAGALIVARALQGAAAAGVPPAAQAALARSRTEHEAGRALSPMMLAVAFAVLAGPALAPASARPGAGPPPHWS